MKRKLCFMASPCPFFPRSVTGSIGVIIVFILLFFNSNAAYSQHALKIGDPLPDITVNDVIHHTDGEIKLSAYKGQLLILDFWATWCSPCIAMLPKTDSLQKAFKDEVVFLPVTYQSAEDVNKLLNRSKKLSGFGLPIVVNDKVLHQYFPHKELPHYVWIDQNGIVKAITGHTEVTASNIRAQLRDNTVALEEKRDVIVKYNRDQPLLLGNLGITRERITYETTFCDYVDGLPT